MSFGNIINGAIYHIIDSTIDKKYNVNDGFQKSLAEYINTSIFTMISKVNPLLNDKNVLFSVHNIINDILNTNTTDLIVQQERKAIENEIDTIIRNGITNITEDETKKLKSDLIYNILTEIDNLVYKYIQHNDVNTNISEADLIAEARNSGPTFKNKSDDEIREMIKDRINKLNNIKQLKQQYSQDLLNMIYSKSGSKSDSNPSSKSNKIYWILGGIIGIILVFFLLRYLRKRK